MIIIRTDAQSNRKALAGALSELFHEKPRYCGAPTFAYEFGVGRLARDASLRLVPSLNETAAERLAAALAERGFSCAVETVCSEIETEDNAPCEAAAEESPVPDSRFTVTIPADRLSPDALARLRKLIPSRHRLFCDALNATELPVEERDGKIAFPWFEQTDDEEEQAAYALFIERLAELSNRLKWAVSAEKDAPNEKIRHALFPAAAGVHRRGVQARPRRAASKSAGQQRLPQWRRTPPNRNGGTSMRRTIRKTFLLEGETVTMRYVKQLCGEERYCRMIEDAKEKFFANPTAELCYPTPEGWLTIWFQLA